MSTDTDVIHAVFADRAVVAEVAITAHAVTAGAAFDAQLIRCAVGAFLTAFLADHIDTVGTAPTATDTDVIHAVFTDTAISAEVIFTAYTFKAGATFRAQLIQCTV